MYADLQQDVCRIDDPDKDVLPKQAGQAAVRALGHAAQQAVDRSELARNPRAVRRCQRLANGLSRTDDNVFVCLYICLYVCIYTHIYMCLYRFIYVYIHTHIYRHPRAVR